MGLIRYSCGHISGSQELIPTKFGLWMFFIMLHRYMVSKTLKYKKKEVFCDVIASVIYALYCMLKMILWLGVIISYIPFVFVKAIKSAWSLLYPPWNMRVTWARRPTLEQVLFPRIRRRERSAYAARHQSYQTGSDGCRHNIRLPWTRASQGLCVFNMLSLVLLDFLQTCIKTYQIVNDLLCITCRLHILLLQPIYPWWGLLVLLFNSAVEKQKKENLLMNW